MFDAFPGRTPGLNGNERTLFVRQQSAPQDLWRQTSPALGAYPATSSGSGSSAARLRRTERQGAGAAEASSSRNPGYANGPTSWPTPTGQWIHRSSPAPYQLDVNEKHRHLPKVLQHRLGGWRPSRASGKGPGALAASATSPDLCPLKPRFRQKNAEDELAERLKALEGIFAARQESTSSSQYMSTRIEELAKPRAVQPPPLEECWDLKAKPVEAPSVKKKRRAPKESSSSPPAPDPLMDDLDRLLNKFEDKPKMPQTPEAKKRQKKPLEKVSDKPGLRPRGDSITSEASQIGQEKAAVKPAGIGQPAEPPAVGRSKSSSSETGPTEKGESIEQAGAGRSNSKTSDASPVAQGTAEELPAAGRSNSKTSEASTAAQSKAAEQPAAEQSRSNGSKASLAAQGETAVSQQPAVVSQGESSTSEMSPAKPATLPSESGISDETSPATQVTPPQEPAVVERVDSSTSEMRAAAPRQEAEQPVMEPSNSSTSASRDISEMSPPLPEKAEQPAAQGSESVSSKASPPAQEGEAAEQPTPGLGETSASEAFQSTQDKPEEQPTAALGGSCQDEEEPAALRGQAAALLANSAFGLTSEKIKEPAPDAATPAVSSAVAEASETSAPASTTEKQEAADAPKAVEPTKAADVSNAPATVDMEKALRAEEELQLLASVAALRAEEDVAEEPWEKDGNATAAEAVGGAESPAEAAEAVPSEEAEEPAVPAALQAEAAALLANSAFGLPVLAELPESPAASRTKSRGAESETFEDDFEDLSRQPTVATVDQVNASRPESPDVFEASADPFEGSTRTPGAQGADSPGGSLTKKKSSYEESDAFEESEDVKAESLATPKKKTTYGDEDFEKEDDEEKQGASEAQDKSMPPIEEKQAASEAQDNDMPPIQAEPVGIGGASSSAPMVMGSMNAEDDAESDFEDKESESSPLAKSPSKLSASAEYKDDFVEADDNEDDDQGGKRSPSGKAAKPEAKEGRTSPSSKRSAASKDAVNEDEEEEYEDEFDKEELSLRSRKSSRSTSQTHNNSASDK